MVDHRQNNCIIIEAGANDIITHADADQALASYGAGDWLVLQNEISSLDYIIRRGKEKSMTVVLNPSPFNDSLNTRFRMCRLSACQRDRGSGYR